MRSRLNCYDLFAAASGVWVGWHVTHNGRRYLERKIVVSDLDGLPLGAVVRVEGMRWRRM